MADFEHVFARWQMYRNISINYEVSKQVPTTMVAITPTRLFGLINVLIFSLTKVIETHN